MSPEIMPQWVAPGRCKHGITEGNCSLCNPPPRKERKMTLTPTRKTCPSCSRELKLTDFYGDKRTADGHKPICIKCFDDPGWHERDGDLLTKTPAKDQGGPPPEGAPKPEPDKEPLEDLTASTLTFGPDEEASEAGRLQKALESLLERYEDVLPALAEAAYNHMRTPAHQAICYITKGLQSDGLKW